MQKDSHLFDDLARVAGGAMSSFATFRDETEARLKAQFERILANMDLVRRDEFEAVQAMAVKAREENETLAKRIDALEGKHGTKTPSRSAKPKSATGKAAGTKAARTKAATKSAPRSTKAKTPSSRTKAAATRRPAKTSATRRRKS